MSLLDRFRRRGEAEGTILIRELPEHHLLDITLGFTRVAGKTSPFPRKDPGAPFHVRDHVVRIKGASEPEVQPFTFQTRQPVGNYYLVLRVMMARKIRGKVGIQIENFGLGSGPLEIRRDQTLQVKGSVTWPTVPDEQLHEYGRLDELAPGGAQLPHSGGERVGS